MLRRSNQRGLSLIELIVAFTILLILTSMAVPLARSKVRSQKERELRYALREMRSAIDKYKDYRKVRKDIAAIKALMPKVYHDIVYRALRLHGSLGLSNEMPFSAQIVESFMTSLADGPTEIHKVTVARQVLREYQAVDGLFPSGHLLTLREKALQKYAAVLELEIGNQ